ncbi:hypothetical protein DSECCO2_581360 [anaerobic digester metagenome]
MLADDVDPARGADLFDAFFVPDRGEPFLDLPDGIPALEGVGVDRHPALEQISYLIDLCWVKTEVIHIAHCVNSSICHAARFRIPNPGFPLFREERAAISLINPTYTSAPVLLIFEGGWIEAAQAPGVQPGPRRRPLPMALRARERAGRSRSAGNGPGRRAPSGPPSAGSKTQCIRRLYELSSIVWAWCMRREER